MNDNDFINIYTIANKKIPSLCKQYPEINDFLLTRFPESTNKNRVETAYRILNDIKNLPKCPICGNSVSFHSMVFGYKTFCSTECKNSISGKKYAAEKYKNTMLKKYGVINPMQLTSVKEKSKQTCLEKYGVTAPGKNEIIRNKQKQTMLEKYGVEHALQSQEIKNKAIQTNIARYGVEHALQSPCFKDKFKNTMQARYNVDYTGQSCILQQKMQETSLSRYGVNNPMKNNDVQEKVKQTCLKKYGVEYVSQSDICKKHMQENNFLKYGVKFTTQLDSVKQKVKETNIKRYGHDYVMKFINKGKQTKKNNNTYITSKVEETLYSKLCKYFGSQNIYRQWNSDCYPFNCDFYIKTYDLYIEIQGSWTHGPHPYDSNNSDDLILKNKWIEKNTDYYKSALDVWTGRDVLKRTYAQNNNLNFIEIFSINATYCFDTIMLYISLKETGYKCY